MDSDVTVNHSVCKNAGKLLLAYCFFLFLFFFLSSPSSNFLPEYSLKYFSWFRFRKLTNLGLCNLVQRKNVQRYNVIQENKIITALTNRVGR